MRKMICTLLALALVLSAGIPAAFAVCPGWVRGRCSGAPDAAGFVDQDQDGVCDNRSQTCGDCGSWTDENGDGVCDNVPARKNAGQRHGRHGRQGRHH